MGGDMGRNSEEPIRDVMQEDQQPTEWEDYLINMYHRNKWFITFNSYVTVIFICFFVNKRTTANFHLHNEQMVNR